jgi:hypothetical protein
MVVEECLPALTQVGDWPRLVCTSLVDADRMRETVLSETAMLSSLSSPWIRGARQSGFSTAICTMSRRLPVCRAVLFFSPFCFDRRAPEACGTARVAIPSLALFHIWNTGIQPDLSRRSAPAAPKFCQSTPEQAVRTGQHRSPPRTLKSAKLESERRILDHNRLVITAQQADESKQAQNHGRHAFDCSS